MGDRKMLSERSALTGRIEIELNDDDVKKKHIDLEKRLNKIETFESLADSLLNLKIEVNNKN
jgi:hypothetical protein